METYRLRLLHGEEDLSNLNIGDAVSVNYKINTSCSRHIGDWNHHQGIYIFAGNLKKSHKKHLYFILHSLTRTHDDNFVLRSIRKKDISVYANNGEIGFQDKSNLERCAPGSRFYGRLEDITNLRFDKKERKWEQGDK